VAFKRALYNIEDTLREQHREFLLETKREDVRNAAERLLERFNKGYSAVMAGRSALEEAARKIPQLRESIRDLPL
jgi:predicted secreted protein